VGVRHTGWVILRVVGDLFCGILGVVSLWGVVRLAIWDGDEEKVGGWCLKCGVAAPHWALGVLLLPRNVNGFELATNLHTISMKSKSDAFGHRGEGSDVGTGVHVNV
jgi:hypothetical protein